MKSILKQKSTDTLKTDFHHKKQKLVYHIQHITITCCIQHSLLMFNNVYQLPEGAMFFLVKSKGEKKKARV